MNALAARRRHPAAIAILLFLGLVLVGSAYSLLAPKPAQAQAPTADAVSQGRALFLANCATCHGLNAQGSAAGPTLVGVGAASVDFQVGTGRMPLANPGVQAERQKEIKFSEDEIAALAAYVASLAPGPAIPTEEQLNLEGADVAVGGELFRVNCAMCHNFAGSGGALTRGKYAPTLKGVAARDVYEAMLTGPQSMPVFNDQNITPGEQAEHHRVDQHGPEPDQPGRQQPRQPRAGVRGDVHLDLRSRDHGRDRRLARVQGRVTCATAPAP